MATTTETTHSIRTSPGGSRVDRVDERTTPRYLVTPAVEGLHRVTCDNVTLGYVLRVGKVYVALQGRVYNTAVEVGQSLEFDAAVTRVVES